MINTLKKILPLNILRTLYNCLVLAHLNYGILAWGRHTTQLDKIQKKTIRILTGSKYNAHTEPLFKQLNLLKISNICKLQEIKFYYKLINNKLPLYFNTFNCQRNSEIHTHNTRQRHALHITRTNHTFSQINLRYSLKQTINSVPYSVIGKVYTHSIQGVTSYAKAYFVSNYQTVCTIRECYVCQP